MERENSVQTPDLNHEKLLKKVPNNKDLSITLKKSKDKGVGVFATKTIKKGDTIAFYKCMVYREKDYESPTDFVYTFHIYRKNGEQYKRLIGDIYEGSFPDPIDKVSFWGPFVNEPSKGQRINSEVDIDTKFNYKDRKFSSPGDTMTYKIVATKMIRPGEEVLWYYGPNYPRNYKVGKH